MCDYSLQQRKIATCEGWRQAYHARLWNGGARVRGIGRRRRRRLRSTGNRAVLCWRSCVHADRSIRAGGRMCSTTETAIFRQINKEKAMAHHDAVEFPDGQIVLLTLLVRVSRRRFFSCRLSQRLPRICGPTAGGLRRLILDTASSKRRLAVAPICRSRHTILPGRC